MPYKVLVAIDPTGLSDLALKAVAKQVAPEQTEVLVVEVVEPLMYTAPPEMSPGYQPENAARRKELQTRAKGVVDAAVKTFRDAGIKANGRTVENEIKNGILETAAEWGADLLVVTSHARKGVAKFFHHSVAQSVVHEAPCSVLVLKEIERKVAAA